MKQPDGRPLPESLRSISIDFEYGGRKILETHTKPVANGMVESIYKVPSNNNISDTGVSVKVQCCYSLLFVVQPA